MSGQCNANEAPSGYKAVLKSTAKPPDGSNICRACDWRPNCNGQVRCMDFAITTSSGKTLQREDGCSVLFKRIGNIGGNHE